MVHFGTYGDKLLFLFHEILNGKWEVKADISIRQKSVKEGEPKKMKCFSMYFTSGKLKVAIL